MKNKIGSSVNDNEERKKKSNKQYVKIISM
jgi:hypothetical protein